MKVVILAGGGGTRLREETDVIPKPMVEIGGKPIIWHIMKLYSFYGLNDFVICLGYKGEVIRKYFLDYKRNNADCTVHLGSGKVEFHEDCHSEDDWKVTLVDTGLHTPTAGRIKQIQRFVGNEDFCLTYGDGVSNINIRKLLQHHRCRKAIATISTCLRPSRFGVLELNKTRVSAFREKSASDGQWINCGFFVLTASVFEYIKETDTSWETEPLSRIIEAGELSFFQHAGFWQPMDMIFERNKLQRLCEKSIAPWMVWEQGEQ